MKYNQKITMKISERISELDKDNMPLKEIHRTIMNEFSITIDKRTAECWVREERYKTQLLKDNAYMKRVRMEYANPTPNPANDMLEELYSKATISKIKG